MAMLEIDAVGMYDTAAEEMGKVFVTTELGGGGSATARTAGIAKRGVRNLLSKAGILKGSVETQATAWLDMPDGDCFSFAEEDGMIEVILAVAGTLLLIAAARPALAPAPVRIKRRND